MLYNHIYNGSPSLKIGVLTVLYLDVDRMIDNFVKKGEVDILWFPNRALHPLEWSICVLKNLITDRRKTVSPDDYYHLTSTHHTNIDYEALTAKKFLETERQKQFCKKLIEYTELLKQAQKIIKKAKSR